MQKEQSALDIASKSYLQSSATWKRAQYFFRAQIISNKTSKRHSSDSEFHVLDTIFRLQ